MTELKKMDKRNERLYICFVCVLAIAVYLVNSNTLKLIIISIIFYSSYFSKKINSTLLLFSMSPVMGFDCNWILMFLATLPAYINKYTIQCLNDLKKRKWILCFVSFLFIVTISYLAGVDPQIKTILLLLQCMLVFLVAMNTQITQNQFKRHAYLELMILAFILLFQYGSGQMSLYYGRLTLNGNVRELANAIAIPTFMFGISLLKENGKIRTITNLLMLGVCSFIILASSSRGVLFSVVLSIMLYFLCQKTKITIKNVIVFLVVSFGVFCLINYIESLGIFKIDRILADENGGLNGRTDIWEAYLNVQFSSIRTMLFGFGPGNVSRLGISNFYAHSLLLDWLFSFGIIGFTYIMIGLIKIFYKLTQIPDKFYLSLFILAIMMFSTHGTATDYLFYILIGVSCCPIKELKFTERKKIHEEND